MSQHNGIPISTTSGRGGILQSFFSHKFRVRLENFGSCSNEIGLMAQVLSIEIPAITFAQKIDSSGLYVTDHTKMKFEDFELILRNDILNLVTTEVVKQNASQVTRNSKFNCKIEMFDSVSDNPLVTYNISNCFIQKTIWAKLDYRIADSNFVTLLIEPESMTVSY